MAGLLDLLNSDLGKTLVNSASSQLGQNKVQTTTALSTALPLILGAMKNNASTPQGADGLLKALSGKHDGSILDNLGGMLGNSDVLSDGAGILGHVFGGKEQNVAQAVSKKSGMDVGATMNLLKMAAPVIMGYIGKQTKQQNVSDSNGIGDLLGGLLGGDAQKEQSLVTKLLDADGDGSIIDDLIGMAAGGKKKGGLGGLLGGLFGK
ncbi:MAG: DUF937 domain-containing protein [Lutibacter sp.]|uniref:DUF937 domain-containing protein n=1 Tax=Lutibacter sp. TaxID=1925666 RepID=UPI0018463BAB|nr:DUF937 domain-containing protein [Lutibacter sp.]MBT8317770.1 DUF937 domain-containing protein [Lutibacter sp.]NNJ58628.1 DUF937 domain-containing protein [Lutibacter sp.]